ncbi:MAG: histidine phosphatase family protein [Acidimicrobiia bacterium]
MTSDGTPRATRVLVLRHGQSTWNASRRWQGQADPPLTDLGRTQARSAAGLLANECPPFDAVVTSDLERARVTGEIIAEVVGCPRVASDPDWRENHAGEWQGLTPDDINRDWPGYLSANRRPPGFETVESTIARTTRALDRLAVDHPGGCVLVISHGGVLRLLRQHFGDADTRYPNLSGGWFEHDAQASWRNGSILFPLELITDELRNTGAVD